MRAWTKVILAGKRDNSRHPTMIFSKNFVVFFFGNRWSNVRSFTILWSGDGLTSFTNLVLESKSLFYGSDSEINILNPRTYTQIHTPTVVQGVGRWLMEPFPKVFDMLQYFQMILPLVEILWSCQQGEVYFMGGGAAGGLWRHQQLSPSWPPS